MRRVIAGLALAVLLVGCSVPAAAPVGGGQAWLCEFVHDAVRRGVMTYEFAAYYYSQCQPLPLPDPAVRS
jgi:hypothetical protein